MPSSTNVNAGDPIKASQYNSLITDMTTIETDMTALETSVNSSIANLEAQTEMLLLNTKISFKSMNWLSDALGAKNYGYVYNNNSAAYQSFNLMQMNSSDGNGAWAAVSAYDYYGTANGDDAWVWEVSTTMASGLKPWYWGMVEVGGWNNMGNGVTGIESDASYGYTIFRYNPDDTKLYAVTRASSADTEEVEDLGLTSSLAPYIASGVQQYSLRIHKDNFSPTPGVKYYINGTLVASHLHANSSGNNQYNNFGSVARFDMGIGSCNRGNTKPSSGSNTSMVYIYPMNCAVATTT